MNRPPTNGHHRRFLRERHGIIEARFAEIARAEGTPRTKQAHEVMWRRAEADTAEQRQALVDRYTREAEAPLARAEQKRSQKAAKRLARYAAVLTDAWGAP